MRADRLVAILLMLQRRDVVTAAEVADELEVSVRTARRDLEALSMAGVPVYAQRGRGGGWRLLGGGRLDLSGLTAGEARSLFVLVGGRREVTAEVRSALRKLLRALPEPLRQGAEAAAASVVVDPRGWDRGRGEPRRPDVLAELESAVIDGEQLHLGYRARSGEETERTVHPLGLAAKGRNWYLIADTDAGLRTFRADRVARADRTGEPVARPDGFDLTEEWARIVADIDRLRTPLEATGTATRTAVPYLRMVFGRRVHIADDGEGRGGGREGDDDGGASSAECSDRGGVGPGLEGHPVRVRFRAANLRALANDLAGFGAWVHVEEPAELCELLAGIGAELSELYGGRNRVAGKEDPQDGQKR